MPLIFFVYKLKAFGKCGASFSPAVVTAAAGHAFQVSLGDPLASLVRNFPCLCLLQQG